MRFWMIGLLVDSTSFVKTHARYPLQAEKVKEDVEEIYLQSIALRLEKEKC
jgi:hypothetical protein